MMGKAIIRLLFLTVPVIVCTCVKKGEDRTQIDKSEVQTEDSTPSMPKAVIDTVVSPYTAILADTTAINDTVRRDTLPYFADYEGYRYYFACGPCRDRFIRRPDRFFKRNKDRMHKVNRRKL